MQVKLSDILDGMDFIGDDRQIALNWARETDLQVIA
jgi:hypothetical protein